ncbi:MAG: hypothetical protein IOD12_11110 [Silvanigrellales bacterium]|nr:hypothetical protein [Silvanigrellales bacterium]
MSTPSNTEEPTVSLANETLAPRPRRRAASEIKLLRLELLPRGVSPCEMIGMEWSAAQPTESLSPAKAAASLGVHEWALPSQVKKRYRTLQLRYPPEQFLERHVEWRPSAELLSSPRARLNWYWQSGLIPEFQADLAQSQSPLWNVDSIEPPLTSLEALRRLSQG